MTDTPTPIPVERTLSADEAIEAVVRKMRAGALVLFNTPEDLWMQTVQIILQDVQNTAEHWTGAADITDDLRGAPGNLYDLDAKWKQDEPGEGEPGDEEE